MEKIIIEGGVALKGSVEISGSKNSSLPILAATALFGGEYTINNVSYPCCYLNLMNIVMGFP